MTIGLVARGVPTVVTRNCVVTVSSGTANPKVPLASVTSGFPMSVKPVVKGNARCWSFTVRPALPVPVSWPASVAPVPHVAGFGFAARLKPSGCFLVVKVLSTPKLVP